jgi:hypothetical protein
MGGREGERAGYGCYKKGGHSQLQNPKLACFFPQSR